MNIILTDMANITPFIIPVTPSDFRVSNLGDNKEENTIHGNISVAKGAKLRTADWSSFFPVNKNYSFIKRGALENGWLYVAFLESMRIIQLPIRIITTTSKNLPVLNMLATIETLEFKVDNAGDIQYSINLKEYPELIYQFAIRDKELWQKAKKYVEETIKNKDIVKKLKDAKLWITERQYK